MPRAQPGQEKDAERARRAVAALRERMLDKTLEDSFPASDPPSSLPNPAGEPEGYTEE